MGLDMYLNKVTSTYSYDKKKPIKVVVKQGKKEKITKATSITEEVGYWRKANAIHKWFVDNIQDEKDDCGTYIVSTKRLQELLNLCKEVKEKAVMIPASLHVGSVHTGGKTSEIYEEGMTIENVEEIADLLPTTSGFFFGSTDYNEFYMNDIDNTINILEKVLNEENEYGTYTFFEYSSSW